MDERDDYVLGRNVTKQALGKEGLLTSVVSIRLSSEEMDAVNAVAEREGKTFAQVVREAIRRMDSAKRGYGWSAQMSLPNGARFGFGDLGAAQSILDYETTVALAPMRASSEEQGAASADSPGA